MSKRTKIHKIYSLLIKAAIILIAFWFIYRRIFIKENIDDLVSSFSSIIHQRNFFPSIFLVIILMLCNWGTETLKWKFMIGKIEKVGFFKSFTAVFSGITVSIFTPNRVGEYAGRVFVLEKASRWEGVLITMLGSMSQLIITIISGSVCFILFVYKYIDLSESPSYFFYAFILIVAVLIFILLLLFFNVSFMTTLVNKLPPRFQKFRHYSLVFTFYKFHELLSILFLSLFRYIIFMTQFFILLTLFGINIPYTEAFILLAMVYLVMAAIPTIALTELGIRGSVAIYFIGMFCSAQSMSGQTDLGILTASSALWLINLAVPAVLGALFIFRLKFFR
ncbi:MAG: lysylphosphatidylglycerol synthase domain-containing protein [Bacteroidota bacterium]